MILLYFIDRNLRDKAIPEDHERKEILIIIFPAIKKLPTMRLSFWAEKNCCGAIDRLRIVGPTFFSTYYSTGSTNMMGKQLLQHSFFGGKRFTRLLCSPFFNTANYVRLCLFHIHSSSISKWLSPFEFCGVKAHA